MAIYTPPYFASSDPKVIESLIQENNFGTLVTITSKQELRFSHLPFLFDRTKASHGILYAHMAKANPQWKDFVTSHSVTAVFQGPHAYISPCWYEPKADNVPTWNYTAVHVHGIPRVLTNPEEAFLVMQDLVQHHDSDWDFNLSAQDREAMMKEIVVFEIVATKIDAKLKMNQNRSKTDQENVSQMLLSSSDTNQLKMGALMKKLFPVMLFALTFFSDLGLAKTVRYELNVTQQPVNLSGKKTVDFALTVNGGIPAPTLEFTEGDEAEITVKNNIPTGEEVSMHWHGILLPPEEDGVAYVNTPPIHQGESRVFRFKIRQHGTYWYHSHTALQEQKGVYGAIIIHPKQKTIAYDKDVVVVLSDWSDENADQILRNLKKDGDYYLYKKNSIRSIFGALKAGQAANYFQNEWERMGGMDLSDVGYDAFLINGKRNSSLTNLSPGQTVRLRIINASASSYFYVSLGQELMKVISADGIDIEPTLAKELLVGMAETYDVLFTPKQAAKYELRATVQDVTGHASGWINVGPSGKDVFAANKTQPDLYATMAMSHGGGHGGHVIGDAAADEDEEDHSGHEMPPEEIDTLTVDDLKSPRSTAFSKDKKIHDVKLVLGGDMERYVWYINGKAIHQDRTIEIQENQVVRFTMVNDTMMHHPMHLHGHFFRVLNKNSDHSPLKHTVDVPPHGTRTIEFLADEPGQWMLHCHNLFHMKTGMARVVKYSSWNPKPEMQHLEHQDPHLHDHIYAYSMIKLATNYADANVRLMRTWDELDLMLEATNPEAKKLSLNKRWESEGDLLYRRWFGTFLNAVVGANLYQEELYGVAGIGYTLPLLIETQTLINHKGKIRISAEKRFQWTNDFFSDAHATWRPGDNHGLEFRGSLMYGPSWHWAVGLTATEKSLGVGAQAQL